MDNSRNTNSQPPALPKPDAARELLGRLSGKREVCEQQLCEIESQLNSILNYLSVAEQVTSALEELSQELFQDLLSEVEKNLTAWLQEILEQPIVLKSEVKWKNNAAAVDFYIERDGNREDILKGQGGSVANIVSVGLRMFALTTLPEKEHRPFLFLDEQDCWLRPDLVPKLVKIVHDAGRALGFQVIMVSHHDQTAFQRYADKIYQLQPLPGGDVEVVELMKGATVTDSIDS